MKLSLLDLKKNKLYLEEKEIHSKYCDGEGKIFKFNSFTGARIDEDCPYCKRLINYKLRRRLEKAQKYEQEITDSTVSEEDSDD